MRRSDNGLVDREVFSDAACRANVSTRLLNQWRDFTDRDRYCAFRRGPRIFGTRNRGECREGYQQGTPED